MAVITTRRVISHPPIPPGGKLRFGMVIGPPIDVPPNGAVVNPPSARSKLGMGPPPDQAEVIKTAIVTEVDTRTGERRTRQERVVNDLPRIEGETAASYNTRNQAYHQEMQAEHQRRREHQAKVRKLQTEETTRAVEADAQIEAKRMEAHDKALDEAQQRADAAVAESGSAPVIERVQDHTLTPTLNQVTGARATGSRVVGVREGSLGPTGSTGPTGSDMGYTAGTSPTGPTGSE